MNFTEAQIGPVLLARRRWLVLAESCTGGLISHRVTNIPGSSAYYLGGMNVYSNEAKKRLLGVKKETLDEMGAVSRETALEMARGVRQAFAGEIELERLIGLAVTGIAGPGGGTPEKPVGLVWIGLSAAEGDQAWSFQFQGNRLENKEQSAEQALRLLLSAVNQQQFTE